jgi:hypothetical protein
MASPFTPRQREVLDHLAAKAAFSREKATPVYGTDANVARKLAVLGVINKRVEARQGDVYWIRPEGEAVTGACILTGFVVILHGDVTTPAGHQENFFLARAPYDGKGFRKLLRGWMNVLKLRPKDLLGSPFGFEVIPADSPVFQGDHLILEEAPEAVHGPTDSQR